MERIATKEEFIPITIRLYIPDSPIAKLVDKVSRNWYGKKIFKKYLEHKNTVRTDFIEFGSTLTEYDIDKIEDEFMFNGYLYDYIRINTIDEKGMGKPEYFRGSDYNHDWEKAKQDATKRYEELIKQYNLKE